jgi:gliding motility-associated-like protein
VDALAEVRPYVVMPYTKDIQKVDPVCVNPNGGEITMMISGNQSPYRFRLNNNVYTNGTKINNLKYGNHVIEILNNDNCVIDIDTVKLDLELTPECDFVFVPNAFTPNNDGLNDILIPYVGEGIYDYHFTVYNRWGQLMYMTREKGVGWDGRYSGPIQPSGAFVWTMSYRTLSNPAKKLIKGTLILVR